MRIVGRTGDAMLDSDATTGAGTRSGSTLNPKNMTAKERAALRARLAAETAARKTTGVTEKALDAAQAAIADATAAPGETAAEAAAAAAAEAETALLTADFQSMLAGEQRTTATVIEGLDAAEKARLAAEAKAKEDAAKKAEADAKAEEVRKAQQKAADAAAAAAAAEEERLKKLAKEAADKAAELEKKAKEDKERLEKLLKEAKEKGDADAIAAAEKAQVAADAKAAKEKKEAEEKAAAAEKARLEAEAKAKAAQDALDKVNAAIAANANINKAGNVITPVTGPYDTVLGAATAADKAAAEYAKEQAKIAEEQKRLAVSQTLTDRFTKYNLTGLIPTIKRLAQEGATESTITFALQETDDYKTRFKANEDRIKKGLSVLSPAEYLNIEDGYRQILRSYGLSQFDNDEYVSQFISNDMSPAELSNRVVTAVQRVRNADPAISKTLKDYYGIGNDDLVAYVLDPNQQLQKIERQVAAAEIGTAARVQGLEAGVSVAEQLAAQGVTQAQAQRGYSTIADILPTAEKLSDIYGGVEDTYRQAEAEQEVFNQLASAQRKRQRLTQREIAQFSGQSGLGRTSLDRESRGQF